jgi:hypothetical protein
VQTAGLWRRSAGALLLESPSYIFTSIA